MQTIDTNKEDLKLVSFHTRNRNRSRILRTVNQLPVLNKLCLHEPAAYGAGDYLLKNII